MLIANILFFSITPEIVCGFVREEIYPISEPTLNIANAHIRFYPIYGTLKMISGVSCVAACSTFHVLTLGRSVLPKDSA